MIANDGKADRLLQATQLLNQRLRDCACARAAQGKDPTPTLQDIEKTHVLHVNAHFKPFAAIAFEYNKVRAQSGQADLTGSGSITFSIPQFGDFFHDMVARMTLGAAYSSLQTSPTGGDTATFKGISSTFPIDGNSWNHVDDADFATTKYTLVNAFGDTVAATTPNAYRNMVRYCEYPGERLFTKVQFDVNGNPLDEYFSSTVSMLRKFTIGADKIRGYKQLVGQEVCAEGHSGPRRCRAEDSHYSAGAPVASTTHGPAGPVFGAPDNQSVTAAVNDGAYNKAPLGGANLSSNQWESDLNDNDIATLRNTTGTIPVPDIGQSGREQYQHVNRACLQMVDGPQTPKYYQPELEIWNRLWFWFNTDARLSVPSVSIPFGQRFITTTLTSQSRLIFEFPGLFVRQADVVVPLAGTAGRTVINYRPYMQEGTINAVTITSPELYVNNLFVNPEVHDIFIRRVGFSLIRVYRRHIATKNQNGSDQELLSQLKWPIEYMFVGLQPTWNANALNIQEHRDWHRMGKTMDSVCNVTDDAQMGVIGGTENNTSEIGQIVPDTYLIDRPTCTNVSLTAHGIKIYDTFPETFFNAYQPFHYGGPYIVSPDDAGAMMINFAIYPGCYQPGAYLNTSRARELYLSWNTAYASSTTPVQLIVIAIALNFLLVTDGSAVLRYST